MSLIASLDQAQSIDRDEESGEQEYEGGADPDPPKRQNDPEPFRQKNARYVGGENSGGRPGSGQPEGVELGGECDGEELGLVAHFKQEEARRCGDEGAHFPVRAHVGALLVDQAADARENQGQGDQQRGCPKGYEIIEQDAAGGG